MNKRNKKKGFTLIEMIVVVAIIAILVGIAVPQVTKQINNSKIKSDVATAKVIAGALQQYIAEGNSIDTTGLQVIDKSNAIVDVGPTSKLDLKPYIDNATSSLQPKVNKSYNFYYEYNASENTIKVYAGPDDKKAKELYPNLSSEYTPNIK